MPKILPVKSTLKSEEGLSLLEVMLAIMIATLSITALVVLGNASISSVDSSRNQAVADQYVRQALEQVRSARDTNGWTAFTTNGGALTTTDRYFSLSNTGVLTYQNDPVNSDPCNFATGVHKAAYTIAGSSNYYQVISLKTSGSNDVIVTATVCFAYRNSTHRSDSAQTILSNWR